MMIGLARKANQLPQMIATRQLGLPVGMGLKGKTVGLVGLGGIGKALAQRLAAFEMRTIGVKRSADDDFQRRLRSGLGELAEPVGGAVGASDARGEGDLQFSEDLQTGAEDGEIGV